jgi:hypothetical protein
MREWMRAQERQNVANRGIPQIVAAAVGAVTDQISKDAALHPTAPIELVSQTAFYLDTTGRRRVRFLLDFPDVTKATTGEDLVISSYELWGRDVTQSALEVTTSSVAGVAAPGLTLPGLAATPANVAAETSDVKPWQLLQSVPGSAFRVENFLPGTVWEFKARAIGASTTVPGEFSVVVQVQMLADTTPPAQPTAPAVVADRGVLTVSWDGQSVLGPMPADFKYAVLAHGTASSPTMEIARFGRTGGFKIVADIGYYDPQFFRVQAVDESGNRSPWSEQAVGYTTPLVDADIILSTIDAAKTYLKNIDARVSILDGTILTEHLVVTEEMTAAIANFLYVKADQIDVNSLAADTVFTGLLDAKLVRSDMFEGKAFTGGTFTGALFQTSVAEYTGIKSDDSGIVAYSAAGGVETFRLDAATGDLTASSGTLTGLKWQTHTGATTGIKIDAATGIKSYNASGQLNFSISSSGAQFTGTVTSGFGGPKAILADQVYSGRPGIKIDTGSAYYSQPFIVSYSASDANPEYKGALYLSSAWAAAGDSPARLLLSSRGTFSLGGVDGTIASFAGNSGIAMQAAGGTVYSGANAYLQSSTGAIVQASENGEAKIVASGGQYFKAGAALTMLWDPYIWIQTNGSGTSIYGGLSVSGAKNFVMEHPLDPAMELLHGATESPVSGVEYWGCGTVGADGTDVFHLPDYYAALVKDENQCVAVYGNGAVVGWGAIIDNSVTVTGPAGTQYSWLVKAERIGGDFIAERPKAQWMPPDSA